MDSNFILFVISCLSNVHTERMTIGCEKKLIEKKNLLRHKIFLSENRNLFRSKMTPFWLVMFIVTVTKGNHHQHSFVRRSTEFFISFARSIVQSTDALPKCHLESYCYPYRWQHDDSRISEHDLYRSEQLDLFDNQCGQSSWKLDRRE